MRNTSRRTMVGAVVGLLIFAGARVAVGQEETGALRDTAVAPQPPADNGNDLGPGQMVLPDSGGYVQPSPAPSNVYAPPRSDSGTYAPPDSAVRAAALRQRYLCAAGQRHLCSSEQQSIASAAE